MTRARIVATCNVFKGLDDSEARHAVDAVLKFRPDILGLQEWGHGRDHILHDLDGYSFARSLDGGGPVVFGPRFGLIRCRAVTLARGGFVGRMPGRKSTLPKSVATLAILSDEQTGDDVAVINFHLTAEVQYAGRYRRDPGHALRVRRHKGERRRLARLVREQRRKGRDVYALGDTNYDGMRLRPLTSCWDGRDGATLGNRAVDVIYTEGPVSTVRTVVTGSDHRTVVATHKEQP